MSEYWKIVFDFWKKLFVDDIARSNYEIEEKTKRSEYRYQEYRHEL